MITDSLAPDAAGRPAGSRVPNIRALADVPVEARLDAIGVFGYSDEGDTEAIGMSGRFSSDEIEARRIAEAA